jgi:hypothetical protein
MDQSLFFYLHITFNIRYAIGLRVVSGYVRCCTSVTNFVTYVTNSVTNGFILFLPS